MLLVFDIILCDLISQIESVEAISNIDAIASVPGVDMLFIGPEALSGSLGMLLYTFINLW